MDLGSLLDGLVPTAGQQFGLFTRRQAVSAGYTPGQVRALVSRGSWVVVRRGAYTPVEVWEAQSGEDDRQWLRAVAAHLTMATPHVLSHDSAARALGLPMLRVRRPLVHITRPGVLGTRTVHGVKHHLGRESPAETLGIGGITVTGLARTSLDLAREHGYRSGLVAIDAARRRGADLRSFERELARMTRWPYVRTARAALEASDPGAESIGETLSRDLVVELGIGPVFTQFAVNLGYATVWCDLRVGCHVFEFDGRQKYLRIERGGFSDEEPSDIVWREKIRERDICGEGLGMSRLVWGDFFGAARDRAKRRLLADHARTVALYGRTLPEHLARFAREHPRRTS